MCDAHLRQVLDAGQQRKRVTQGDEKVGGEKIVMCLQYIAARRVPDAWQQLEVFPLKNCPRESERARNSDDLMAQGGDLRNE